MHSILYVEDNTEQAEAVIWRLQRRLGEKWEIDPYAQFDEAKEAISHTPDKWLACFVDLDLRDRRGYGQMKGMENLDGVLIAKLIRKLSPEKPIVLVSASVEEDELDFEPDIRSLFNEVIDKSTLESHQYRQSDTKEYGIAVAIFQKMQMLGLTDE